MLQIDEWLVTNLPEGARVGLDPFCHTVDGLNKIKAKLEVSEVQAAVVWCLLLRGSCGCLHNSAANGSGGCLLPSK